MALSRIDFWNDFFFQRPTPADASLKSEAHEWYISAKDTHDIVLRKLKGRHRASTKILHNGCGSSELGVILAEEFLQVSYFSLCVAAVIMNLAFVIILCVGLLVSGHRLRCLTERCLSNVSAVSHAYFRGGRRPRSPLKGFFNRRDHMQSPLTARVKALQLFL